MGIFTQVIHNPHYGEQGKPFTVVAGEGDRASQWSYWTLSEAMDRRDELLDQGWHPVRVIGAPTIIAGN
jgi:hypothetical protein